RDFHHDTSRADPFAPGLASLASDAPALVRRSGPWRLASRHDSLDGWLSLRRTRHAPAVGAGAIPSMTQERRMAKKLRDVLTAQFQRDLCAFIRAGAYPHVAAEALGVPHGVFARWLRRGNARDGPQTLRDLADAVRRAAAEARVTAEHEVRKDDALDWLKFGL